MSKETTSNISAEQAGVLDPRKRDRYLGRVDYPVRDVLTSVVWATEQFPVPQVQIWADGARVVGLTDDNQPSLSYQVLLGMCSYPNDDVIAAFRAGLVDSGFNLGDGSSSAWLRPATGETSQLRLVLRQIFLNGSSLPSSYVESGLPFVRLA